MKSKSKQSHPSPTGIHHQGKKSLEKFREQTMQAYVKILGSSFRSTTKKKNKNRLHLSVCGCFLGRLKPSKRLMSVWFEVGYREQSHKIWNG